MQTRLVELAGTAVHASPEDLALVGEIAALVDARHLLDSLDVALQRLRDHSGAEAAELFFADPRGQEMFLVSHQGADLDAFCQRDRFRAGEGYPGIALRTSAPVLTASLPSDVDFLRSRVKALHYQSVVCVPIRQDEAVSGCVLLAWKESAVDLERAALLAALVSRPISVAVEVVRARIRLHEFERLSARGRGAMDTGDRWFPVRPANVISASPLSDAAGQTASVTFVVRGIATEETACRARSALQRCPARHAVRPQIRGGRAGWPEHCLHTGCTTRARYCIPLTEAGRVWGVATVAFRERAPVPLTRHLPTALWLTEDLTPCGSGPGARPADARPARDARLAIRCLGGFSVTLDGRTLSRAALGRSKAIELLALLVAASGRPRSGVQLAEALWPDASPPRARNRFHVTLSALRRAIEPPGAARWTHVRRDGSSYCLDARSSLYVDLWHLRDLVRRAGSAAARGLEGDARSLLEEAVALYDGDPDEGLLTGGPPDILVRQSQEAVLHALDRLADAQVRGGDPRAALETLRRAEVLDPVRQPAQSPWMETRRPAATRLQP